MRKLWCGMLLLSGLLLGGAQPVLAEDPRLQKPVSVWLKMEPLGDVLRLLTRETGVRLSCSSTIRAHKVAIFVSNRPAHEVLTQLARALRYEWRVREEENGYMLVQPDALRRQEAEVERALREARRQALQDLIRAAREFAAMSPESLSELSEQARSAPDPSLPPEQQQRQLALYYMAGIRVYSLSATGAETHHIPPEATLLRCLAAMPPAAINALLNGEWVGLSTHPARGIYPYPRGVPVPHLLRQHVFRIVQDGEGASRPSSEPSADNPEWVGLWVRLSPQGGNTLHFRLITFTPEESLMVLGDAPSSAPRLRQNQHTGSLRFHLLPYLQEHPLLQSWREWATPAKEWARLLPSEVKPPSRPAPPKPIYYGTHGLGDDTGNRFTTADVLERLAWLTQLPVIGDAFRSERVVVPESLLHQPLMLLRTIEPHYWLRLDESGYLLARTQLYWLRHRWELPEERLRALERDYMEGKWLDLRAYIELAASLSADQVELYTLPEARERVPLAACPIEPLVHGIRGLRFLASLTPAQLRMAMQGEWIPASVLNAAQRQRFAEALSDFFPPKEWLFNPIPPHTEPLFDTGAAFQSLWAQSPPLPQERPDQPAFQLEVQSANAVGLYARTSPSGYTIYGLAGRPASSVREGRSDLRNQQIQVLRRQSSDGKVYEILQVNYTLRLSAPPQQKEYHYPQRRLMPAEAPPDPEK